MWQWSRFVRIIRANWIETTLSHIRISEAMSMHLSRPRCGSKPFLTVYKAFWLIARGLGSCLL